MQADAYSSEVGRSYPRSSRHRMNASGRDWDQACWVCQFDKLTGFEELKPGRNIELDPTLTYSRTDEIDGFPEGDLEEAEDDTELGLTARWGITPSLALTGTVNPDFSQVEADVAQLDVNERFALFFPETRPFFLEGIAFFNCPNRVIFTRTVVDPDWGVKLAGRAGRNNVGVFAAEDNYNTLLFPSNQATASTLLDEPVTSGVLRYRRDVGASSAIGVVYTGREGDDLWEVRYEHTTREWNWAVDYEDYGPGFRADNGFMPRVDMRKAQAKLNRTFWPEEDRWYDRWSIGSYADHIEDHEGQLTDEAVQLYATVTGSLQFGGEAYLNRRKEHFDGVLYEDLDGVDLYAQLQPSGSVWLALLARFSDAIDYANNQPGDEQLLNPQLELKIGRHINANLDHSFQKLNVDGGTLFVPVEPETQTLFTRTDRTVFFKVGYAWIL